jgi:hypothetical protein
MTRKLIRRRSVTGRMGLFCVDRRPRHFGSGHLDCLLDDSRVYRGSGPPVDARTVGHHQYVDGYRETIGGRHGGWCLLSVLSRKWVALMLGLAAVPSVVMFVGFLHLPESPRWLASKGRLHEAAHVLSALRETEEEALKELQDIAGSVPQPQQQPLE